MCLLQHGVQMAFRVVRQDRALEAFSASVGNGDEANQRAPEALRARTGTTVDEEEATRQQEHGQGGGDDSDRGNGSRRGERRGEPVAVG